MKSWYLVLIALAFVSCRPEVRKMSFNKLAKVENAGDQLYVTDEEVPVEFEYAAPMGEEAVNPIIKIVEGPANGKLEGCQVSDLRVKCVYRPNKDFVGSDAISLQVEDGALKSAIATVNFQVNNVNDRPEVGADQNEGLQQNTVLQLEVNIGQDKDSPVSKLTYHLVDQTANGTLKCFNSTAPRQCLYTPKKDFFGQDTFTYKVKDDGGLESLSHARVNITVSKNPPPKIGLDQSFKGPENTELKFLVSQASDPVSTPAQLQYVVVTPSSKGIVKCSGIAGDRSCSYTPNKDFVGKDSFTYKVKNKDNISSANIATVSFDIFNVNQAPKVAADEVEKGLENKVLNFEVNAASDDESILKLQYKIIEAPKSGVIKCFAAVGDRKCSYTPNKDFSGTDSFTYKVIDAEGLESSGVAKVSLQISLVNRAPNVGVNQSERGKEDQILSFDVNQGSDRESSASQLVYVVATSPKNGSLKCFATTGSRSCQYTPTKNFFGSDSFTYKIKDHNGIMSATSATVSITIDSVNDAPLVGADQSFTINENKVLSFEVSAASDIDSPLDQLVYKVETAPTKGVLKCFSVIADRKCTYTPNKNYFGIDSFTYSVTDNQGLKSVKSAKVGILVNEVNDPPTLGLNQEFNVNKGQSVSFEVSLGSDQETPANQLVYELVSAPSSGSLACFTKGAGDRSCKYDADLKFVGKQELRYRVVDEKGLKSVNEAVVVINVLQFKYPPVVGANQAESLLQATNITFKVNMASDPDTAAMFLTYSLVDMPANGTVDCFKQGAGDRGCLYTPNKSFSGEDSFTYKVTDSDGITSAKVASVKLIVSEGDFRAEENFIQNEQIIKGVDIVWVIDNSGSMSNEQEALSANFDAFINNFLSGGEIKFDFNMGVTTSDAYSSSRYNGQFVKDAQGNQYDLSSDAATKDLAKFKTDFKAAVKVGINGSGSEKSLSSMDKNYTDNVSWFKGNDHLLVYIILSDEKEQSFDKTASEWVTRFQSLKDKADKVRIYPIIRLSADSDNRYADIASLSSGALFDIYSPFNTVLDTISNTVSSLIKNFKLRTDISIFADSIKVFVDGVELPKLDANGAKNWDFIGNAIVFTNSPQPLAKIQVTYRYNYK